MKNQNQDSDLQLRLRELERQNRMLQTDIEKFRSIFDDAPLGVFRSTVGGKYIEVNNTFAVMLGYADSDDLIKCVKNIEKEIYIEPKLRNVIIKELLKGTDSYKCETSYRKKNGDVLPVNLFLKLIREKNGKALYVSGIAVDVTNRKKTENILLSERNQFYTLLDNIPDCIYLKDQEGKFIIANKSLSDLLGLKSPDLVCGKVDEEFSLSSLAKLFIQGDEEILKHGKTVLNNEISGEDGKSRTIKYFYISKVPLRDSHGKAAGLIGIGRNITDIKQAEQKISESQANLTAVLESTKNLIWSVDRNYSIITANSQFRNFFKIFFRHEIKIGDNFLKYLPEPEKKNWNTILRQVLKGEQISKDERYSMEGESFYFEVSASPILNGNGSVSGVTVVSTDISGRKIAEEVLRESEIRFRQLAENTNDVFILYNNYTILYANHAFEKVYGRPLEQLYSDATLLEKSIHPDDRQDFLKNRKKEFSSKVEGKGSHYRILRQNGEIRQVWIRNYPVYNKMGKVYRYVSVTSDMTEIKELETIVENTKNQQKAILDNIPYLAWLKDNDGRYILVNQPFADSYNLKVETIIGKTDYDICSKEKADEYYKNDIEVKKSRNRQFVEQVEDLPTRRAWYETFKTPILDDRGNVIGITGISRDVSDRAQMEKTLREREEHFRALLQNSSDAISILDQNGTIVFESSARNKILDFNIEELLNKSIFEIVHPDDVEAFKQVFSEVIDNPDKQIKWEYRSLHKNKRWIYVESIFSNQINNLSIGGIVVNSRDISDRKMAELKERVYHDNLIFLSNSALELLSLSSKEEIYRYIPEKLSSFLDNSIVIVTSYNNEEKKISVESISGIEPFEHEVEKTLGRSLIGLEVASEQNNSVFENAGMVVTLTDDVINETIAVLSPDQIKLLKDQLKVHKIYNILLARNNKRLGNITILTLNKSIIKFKHIIETFVHQVSVVLQRSQLEYELIKARDKAEESDKLKTAFLANMSHEIRTPMNGILGFAEMLNDDKLSIASRKKYLDIINSNGKMLINLIDDIIDFAKIESGQVNIIEDDFSVNTLLNQVQSSFLTGRLKKDKSKVVVRTKKSFLDDKSYIHTDPTRLRQVLTNLVGNAIKFTHEGYIEFGYSLTEKNRLLFYVKDTGIGIPSEKLELIFERFIQADNSPSRKYGGSGLGLAISKGLIGLLGGEMWAESTVGKGSSFYFTIPYITANKIEEIRLENKPSRTKYIWEGRLFLIAEDDKFSYKFLEGFLKQTKAEVLHASDGREAVEICRKHEGIDLVLMDIQMPEMNGLVATEEIKKFNRHIPIIAQTANAIAEEKQRCFKAGCDDFITKPVNITELYAKIDKWLSVKNPEKLTTNKNSE